MNEQWMTINGKKIAFDSNQTILAVAHSNGISIPTLCRLKGTTPTGACRICVVEVAGARTLMTACSTPAADGMVVLTESSKVVRARRAILEMMLSCGNHNCAIAAGNRTDWSQFQERVQAEDDSGALCPAWGDCKLQELAYAYQVSADPALQTTCDYPMELKNPLIVRDFSRCILCGRCVQACNEVQVHRAISFGYRGAKSKIVAAGDRPLVESDCVFCGECVQACPVGALVEKRPAMSTAPGRRKKCVRPVPIAGWAASSGCMSRRVKSSR